MCKVFSQKEHLFLTRSQNYPILKSEGGKFMHRSRARRSPFSSKPMKVVPKSLGQDFLKDCGFQKGKALCLHPKPISTLFHNFRSVYTQCALRGVNCITIRGIVMQERGALQERAPLWKAVSYRQCFQGETSLAGLSLFSQQSPGLLVKFTLCRAHCV